MILNLKRYFSDRKHTKSLLFVNGEFVCHVLEDLVRCEKIHGQTAIPAGIYRIQKREVVSPMTETYRNKFSFFDYHFELQDVPNFKHVYIHVGNDADDTEGCLLVGLEAYQDTIGNSRAAFKIVWNMLDLAIQNESITIKIEDNGTF